jgi:hypothetical protein
LWLIVDLAEIENGSLHRFVGSQAMVFDDAEVAMILAVFVALDAPQKHDKRRVPDLRPQGKVLGLHSTVFSESDHENTRLHNKNQSKKPKNVRNCESWANASSFINEL